MEIITMRSNTISPILTRIIWTVFATIVLLTVYTITLAPKASAAPCSAPSTDYGTVTSTVTIPQSVSYRIWSRMLTPNATDNSYMLEVDGNSCFVVGDGSFNATTWGSNSSNWVDYQGGTTTNKINMTLSAGSHTIKMIGNAPNVELDRVVFTSDTSCTPTGTGENCANPPDTTAPTTVNITAPANSSTQPGAFTINVTAADDVGGSGIQRVEFLIDNVSKNTDTTSPYSYTLPAALAQGSHTLIARAYDVAGNMTSSGVVTVNVPAPADTTDPVTSITSPANGTPQVGTILISANATDNVGVTKVEFYVDGQLKGTDATSPYSISLDTTGSSGLTNGNHTLTTKAFDAAGRTGTSAGVTINVNNPVTPPPDTTPPTVSVSNPGDGTPQSGVISFSANATDNVAVTKVDFIVDGTVVNTDSSAPYNFALDTKTLGNGSRVLRVRAYDANQSTLSATITITVNNVTYVSEDIDQDGKVGLLDFSKLANKFGQTGSNLGREDIDQDGKIGLLDFSRLANKFGYTNP